MELTRKNVRVIELFSKYKQYNLQDNLKEYYHLIDTLIYLHEVLSEKHVEIKYWQKLSETLINKFYFHGLTLHNILSGLKVKSEYYKEEFSGAEIIDISSAKVVFRAQLEAFLMYHHIYVNPNNDDLKELRYYAWIYSSLLQRQNFPAETKHGKKQKQKDRIELNKIAERIKALNSYKKLTSKQQQSLLESGSGKLFNHWSTILKETGFSEKGSFFTLYAFLSIYSHSEGLSAIQLDYDPNGRENTISQAYSDLQHSKFLVCFMITSLTSLYEEVQNRFNDLPEILRYDIEIYTLMAKSGQD